MTLHPLRCYEDSRQSFRCATLQQNRNSKVADAGTCRAGCWHACGRTRHGMRRRMMALSLVRRRRIIEILTTFVICSVLLGGCAVGSNTLEGVTTPLPAGVLPKFAHVFVIMLENRGYTQVM